MTSEKFTLESVPPVHSASTDHGPGFPGYLAASGGNQVRRVCRSSLKVRAGSRQSSKAMEAARALNRADEDTFLFRRSACCKAFFGSSGFELRADQEPCSSSHSRSDPKPRFHPLAGRLGNLSGGRGAQTHASSSGARHDCFRAPCPAIASEDSFELSLNFPGRVPAAASLVVEDDERVPVSADHGRKKLGGPGSTTRHRRLRVAGAQLERHGTDPQIGPALAGAAFPRKLRCACPLPER